MARSQETYGKKEKEKKRKQKRDEKKVKREERKANSSKGADFEDMIAYVDENGNITDTPPDPLKKKVVIKASSIEIGVPKREDLQEEKVKKGKIEFFNESKGYGFIKENDTQEKYFVHVNGLIDDVVEGDKVSFELERGLKGMNAIQVKKI